MSGSTLNIGVIGAGGIARRKTIPALVRSGSCRLVAVMNPSRAEEIAAEFDVPAAYTTVQDLLQDSAVEAVYIASPVHVHAQQIEQAALAGKHILCEKPLTRTLREAENAVAHCRRQGVILQEGYMMKFHGAHVKMKELIERGRLGRVVSIRAQLSCWYPPMSGAWRQDPGTGGGGALMDMATHLYDLLVHFAGPVKRIMAMTGRLVHGYSSEDASTTLLEFASGAHATVDSFFCIPDEASRTRLEIYGSQGALLSEGTVGQGSGGTLEGVFGLGEASYDAAQNKDLATGFERISFDPVDPYNAEFEAFARSAVNGETPELNGVDNTLRIMKLVDLAYASAAAGRAMEA